METICQCCHNKPSWLTPCEQCGKISRLPAISLYGPWAHLMAAGAKKNETCGWPTSYRGDIAIHAGKVLDRQMAADDRVLAAMGWDCSHEINYPAGAVLCVVEIYHTIQTDEDGFMLDEFKESDEYHFGDYSPGRWVWLTRNLRPLKDPVRTRGYQKIWTLDQQVERLVRDQLV